MKLLAFGATSSKNSINKALVSYAGKAFSETVNPSAEVEVIDLNDFEMPIYSIDREMELGIPPQARHFFDKITDADALIISYAEHNGLYTAAFKNIFDWASRIDMKVYQNKPMIIMSASIGPNGGANVLKTALEAAPFFGADIIASMSIGRFEDNFDSTTGELSNKALSRQLVDSLHLLNDSLNTGELR